MKRQWEERVYGLIVALHPRRLKEEHGTEMKLVLNDLLHDPGVPRWRVWLAMLGDLRNLSGGGAWLGALFGSLVVLIWWVNRSDIIPFDPTLGLVLIALLFVAAGFVGTWRSRSFMGGLAVGFEAGVISAVTVPGDYWFFHSFPFYDPVSFVLTMAISGAVVIFLVALGAEIISVANHGPRMRRGLHAFVDAWRQIPS